MTMYSAAVTHSHCEDCGQATMRLEYEKVHDRVVPCYCLAAMYRGIGLLSRSFLLYLLPTG